MDLLLMVLGLKIVVALILVLSGSNKNIESRTEREEELLKKDK